MNIYNCMSYWPCMLHVLLGTGPRSKSSIGMQSSNALRGPISNHIEFDLNVLTGNGIHPWTWSWQRQDQCLSIYYHRGVECFPSQLRPGYYGTLAWRKITACWTWLGLINLLCGGWTNEVQSLSSPASAEPGTCSRGKPLILDCARAGAAVVFRSTHQFLKVFFLCCIEHGSVKKTKKHPTSRNWVI
jgi:hypothetical protein